MIKNKLPKIALAFFAATLPAFPTLAATLSQVGTGAAIDVSQPSIEMHAYIRVTGPFEKLGEIRWYAGRRALADDASFMRVDGRTLDIASNSALYSVMGTTYGGNGVTTFNLPDLQGRAVKGGTAGQMGTVSGATDVSLTEANLPSHVHDLGGHVSDAVGGGQAFSVEQPSITLKYEVQTSGTFPGGFIPGETYAGVGMTAATIDYNSQTIDADGVTLSISQNNALFSLLGTIYGGDGRSTFNLPDTIGKIVTGAGTGAGLTPRTLGSSTGSNTQTLSEAQMAAHSHTLDTDTTSTTGGSQPVSLLQQETSLNWIIALNGLFPSSAGSIGSSPFEPIIGELALFAGNFAPRSWAFAHGQILDIASHTALFSLLGTQYGGDGRTSFALPDLRGRTVVGSDNSSLFASSPNTFGAENTVLSQSQLGAHTHEITSPSAVPLPGAFFLLLGGVGTLTVARRLPRRAA